MQKLLSSHSIDYIVCLTLDTTKTKDNYRRLFQSDYLSEVTNGLKQETASLLPDPATFTQAKTPGDGSFPLVVELDWCIYSLGENRVEADQTVLVNPNVDNFEVREGSGLTVEKLVKEGVTFEEAIKKVSAPLQSTRCHSYISSVLFLLLCSFKGLSRP